MFVVALVFVGTVGTSQVGAQSFADLAAQIQALLQQVQALQAQLRGVDSVTTVPGACVTVASDLSRGSRGNDVSALQEALRNISAYSGPVTGFFGPLTQTAVRAFQAENGIAENGVVDDATAAAINRLSCGAEPVVSPVEKPTNVCSNGASNYPHCNADLPFATSTTPSISILSPNGGENIVRGGQNNVSWKFSGDDAAVKSVALWLFTRSDRQVGWVTSRFDEIKSPSGSYVWDGCYTDPASQGRECLALDDGYKITAIAYGQFDRELARDSSDATFSIVDTASSPAITVTSPSAKGETWTLGSTHLIKWNSYNWKGLTVGIALKDSSGYILHTIASGLAGGTTGSNLSGGFYSWTIPSDFKYGPGSYHIYVYSEEKGSSTAFDSAPLDIVTATSTSTTTHPHGTAPYNYGWDDFTSPVGADHSTQIIENYRAHPEEYGLNPIGNNGYIPNPYLYGTTQPTIPTNVLRLYKSCGDHWINRKENIPVEPGGYQNYRCTNRYQQQCIDDGSFDSYYDEACLYNETTSTTTTVFVAPSRVALTASFFEAARENLSRIADQVRTIVEKLR